MSLTDVFLQKIVRLHLLAVRPSSVNEQPLPLYPLSYAHIASPLSGHTKYSMSHVFEFRLPCPLALILYQLSIQATKPPRGHHPAQKGHTHGHLSSTSDIATSMYPKTAML